ncbi:hypothetical protein PM082_004118 [Marasmius tenuissimus]|nr:hypothetical protein PM082_004118 [Marasmius tenuissimus]
MNESLYSSKPVRSYTLQRFFKRGAKMADSNPREFQSFFLTGETKLLPTQALVDIQPNMLDRSHLLYKTRDYDSLIGITDDIIVTNSISLYVVPNLAEVLKKSVHLSHPMVMGGETVQVQYHSIPNFLLAHWGNRCQIHIFFPKLYDRNSPCSLGITPAQVAEFYVKGVRPTIEEILPESVSDWPPSYTAEVFRITRTSTGRPAYGSKMLPREFLKKFVDVLREKLAGNKVSWAAEFFFMHSVRGVKLTSFHDPNLESAAFALEELLSEVSLSHEATSQGRWYIDVALEVRSQKKECLQWTTHSHPAIIAAVLQISQREANRMTGLGSSRYQRDNASHLTALSGCRIEPRSGSGPLDVVYIQLYTTDKATTYCPEGGFHGKAISMKMAMGCEQPVSFLSNLIKSYIDSVAIASHARVEVRVPFHHALDVLLNIPKVLIQKSLAAFECEVWWGFRAYRGLAASHILSAQAEGPSRFRVSPDALLLTSAMVWLINGLHSRPDDGSAARDLMRACLPLTEGRVVEDSTLMFVQTERTEETELGQYLAHCPYGVMFLRRIKTDTEMPRFRAGGPWLGSRSFQYWFKMDMQAIRFQYHDNVAARKDDDGPLMRVQNKTRSTKARTAQRGDDDVPMFDLESQGFAIPPPPVDEGSDMEVDTEPISNEPTIDQRLKEIFLQCLVDILNKAPNPVRATDPSYLKIGKNERMRAGEEVYTDLHLSNYWRQLFYKVGSTNDFQEAFDQLFNNPRASPKKSNAQNYWQTIYYQRWVRLCAEVDDETIEAMRRELRKRYDGLLWAPYSTSDRIWNSRDSRNGKTETYSRLPIGSTGPAPRILVRQVPSW